MSPAKKKKKLLASHQRSWIWGRRLVREVLEAGRWPILELHLSTHLATEEREAAERCAAEADIPVLAEEPDRLYQLAHQRGHQGYLARMGPFPYTPEESLLKNPAPDALLVLLDRIQDPFNFGAILRSAEVLGVDGVIIGSRDQATVNSQVARSSAGAVNRIPTAQSDDLADMLRRLKALGYYSAAADEKSDTLCTGFDFARPMVLVIGNEGEGVDPALHGICETGLAIPQGGAIGSLNAAAAAAILFYEARRNRLKGT
jgi:23S rRNA (guanosine2251-2'-O)-methyltransferase